MTTLTPSLSSRKQSRTNGLAQLKQVAGTLISRLHQETLHRHDRLSVHPDPAMRSELRDMRQKVHKIGHRFETVKARVEGADLSDDAQWTIVNALPLWGPTLLQYTEAQLATALSGLPAAPLASLTAREWAYVSTVHDVDEAMEAELRETLGAEWLLLSLGVGSLTLDQIRLMKMIQRRYRTMRTLTTLPVDPFDGNLWGHDARLSSLSVENGNGAITLKPTFKPSVLSYTMEYRGDQVHRITKAVNDSTASAVEREFSDRIEVEVTAEDGVTKQLYVVKGNADASLAALKAVTTPGNVDRALTPAFASATTAYQTPSAIPLGALTVTGTPTATGAKTAVAYLPNKSSATSIEVTVTAPDGTTTKKYTITRAAS